MKRSHAHHDEWVGPRWRGRWRLGLRRQDPTRQPDPEPVHDQPWIPRSAFTDRLRRSPRR
jgi:hypothetical protein